jgi:putative Ca2+/H+ antiporter (TMEM165/GDT1 family)
MYAKVVPKACFCVFWHNFCSKTAPEKFKYFLQKKSNISLYKTFSFMVFGVKKLIEILHHLTQAQKTQCAKRKALHNKFKII